MASNWGVALTVSLLLIIEHVSAAENTNRPDKPADSRNETNYIEDGQFHFAKLTDASKNYTLRKYVDSQLEGWSLQAYVSIARSSINNLVSVDWDLMRGLVNNKQLPEIQPLIMEYKGPLVMLAFGLISGMLFWIVGCCVCSCRLCCKKCGGRYTEDDVADQSFIVGIVFLVVTVLSCIFLLVGAGAIFNVGKRIPKAPEYVVNVIGRVIDDFDTYVKSIVDDVNQVARDDLIFAVDEINHEVDDMPNTVTKLFLEDMRPKIAKIVETLEDLNKATDKLKTNMDFIENDKVTIVNINNDLQTQLSEIKVELTDIKSGCSGAHCPGLPDGSLVPDVYDFNKTPDLADQMQLINDATGLDFVDIGKKATDTFEDIPKRIDASTKNTRESISTNLNQTRDSIGPMIDSFRDSVGELPDVLKTNNPSGMLASFLGSDMLKKVPTVFSGIAAIVIIIVLAGGAGMALGGVSYVTKKRGTLGQASHGLLIFSVVLSFVFMPLYMLPGSLCFALGAPLVVICKPLEDLSIFTEVIDQPNSPTSTIVSKPLFGDKNVSLPVGDIFRRCRNNEPVYAALKLENLLNLTQEVNIRDKLPDMTSLRTNVDNTLQGIQLLSDADKAEFQKIKDSNAKNFNPDAKMKDMNDGINNLDLNPLVAGLQKAKADTASVDAAMSARFNALVGKAENLQVNVQPTLTTAVQNLDTKIKALPGQINEVMTLAGTVFTEVKGFQDKLQKDGGDLIMAGVVNFKENVIAFSEQFISHVQMRVKKDLGKCAIVWDIYDAIVGILCSFFLDSFNGFWLSLTIIGTFLITYVAGALVLVNYVRADIAPGIRDDSQISRPSRA